MGFLNKLICVFIVYIFLQSCDPIAYKTIYVLKPAKVKVPKEIYRVLLIDRSRNINYRYYGEKEDETTGKQLKYPMDSLMSDWIFQGVLNKFSNSPRFELPENPVKTIFKANNSIHNKYFSWDEVDTLCVRDSLDAVIVLEYFVNDSISSKIYYDQRNGYYRFEEIAINSSLWRIYDDVSHIVSDQYWQHDTIRWKGTSYNRADYVQSLPYRDDALLESCFKMGQKYGARIAHQWSKVTRLYYQRSNSDFKKAAGEVETDNWQDAVQLWKKYINAKDSNLAARACFNMAVACEVSDDIDAALDWAAKSYFKSQLPEVENYIVILEKRKKNNIKISNLLNP